MLPCCGCRGECPRGSGPGASFQTTLLCCAAVTAGGARSCCSGACEAAAADAPRGHACPAATRPPGSGQPAEKPPAAYKVRSVRLPCWLRFLGSWKREFALLVAEAHGCCAVVKGGGGGGGGGGCVLLGGFGLDKCSATVCMVACNAPGMSASCSASGVAARGPTEGQKVEA